MGKKIDIVGQRFGRWEVLSESEKRVSGNVFYTCKCDCGTVRDVSSRNLRDGSSMSCGCLNRDIITKFGNSVYKEKLYSVWNSMKQRCINENDKAYKNYGGRGITVCDEWKNDYIAFKRWALSNGYSEGMWIDRKDNEMGYSPDNCRWSSPKQQSMNKRTTVYVKYCGTLMCLREASEKSGIKWATLRRRIKLGWNEENLFLPVDKRYSHPTEIKESMVLKK